MAAHRFRPDLEELGSRILPSVATEPLAGDAQGTVTTDTRAPDLGTDYLFQGTAHLAGLGDTTVTGFIRALGLVRFGDAQGRLTFANARGSVTVSLVGPEQAGLSALPSAFTFKVVAATGDFAGVAEQGTLALTVNGAGGWAAALAPDLLAGTAQGTYTVTTPNADVGDLFTLQGTGDLAGLGPVTVNGTLTRLGYVLTGHANGTLTFTNGTQTVTAQLLGPEQTGFAA